MSKKVLVVYATKHGSTREIAEKVGEVIKSAGNDVSVVNAREAPEPSGYDAVVLGSAAYIGSWRGEAVKYLKKNQAALARIPSWMFMSGPTNEGDPIEQLKGVLYPNSMKPVIDAIQPREVTAFHGNSSPDNFGGWEKWILKRVGNDARDARDWDMITTWAQKVAGELK